MATFNQKALDVLKTVAPTLAGFIPGPLGTLASTFLSKALGVEDPKAAEAAILSQDPATLLALKKADEDFQIHLKELDIDEKKMGYADVADARALAKTNMTPQMWLSGTFVGGYFGTLLSLIFDMVQFDSSHATLLNVLMGVLTAGVIKILDFWFGSTSGSQSKDVMLYNSKPAAS